MNVSQNRLNLVKENGAFSYSDISQSIEMTTTYPCKMAVYDSSNELFFIAAGTSGLIKTDKNSNHAIAYFPNGPAYNDPFTMKFTHDKLYVTTSGASVDFGIPGAVMIYDGNTWINITNKDIPDKHFENLLTIEVDPQNASHFFVSCRHKGLYEFKDNTFFKRYNYANTNDTIQLHDPNNLDNYQIVDGLTFDKDGNLWMVQSSVSNALKVLKKNMTWETFYFPNYTNKGKVRGILMDNNGFKWLYQIENANLFVFNDNNTIDKKTDDHNRLFTPLIDQDGNSFSSTVFPAMVMDKKNPQKLWLGTDKGPVIIPNAKKAFDADFRIQRIKIPRNDGTNLADYLLESETVNAIAVDGANRKWIGTKGSGVLLVSENGTETIYHFTTENSPLLSNTIQCIAIDDKTGEVFIGTNQGIISFMGDSTEPLSIFSNVHAYPNPVRETYHGLISIVGLVDETNVKITDVAGNLVYETTSNGGMATWDGNNIYGHRVGTGVYLALCSSPNGKEDAVCKILIINN